MLRPHRADDVHHGRLPTLNHLERFAQRLRIGAVDFGRQHFGALDLDRLRRKIVALTGGEFRFEAREFLFERLHVLDDLADLLRHLRHRRFQRGSGLLQRFFLALNQRQRAVAAAFRAPTL